jgi:hypothetical protein
MGSSQMFLYARRIRPGHAAGCQHTRIRLDCPRYLKRNLDRLTVLDVLLIAVLLALPGWALVTSWRAAREQPVAYIYHNNSLLGVYQLDRDQVIVIGDKARPDMKIEIKGGRIRVAESDCPKGVCKQAGWVQTPGRSIVCVPNKVLIELRGERREYDAESY